MVNRLKEWIEEPDERPPAKDYFEIACEYASYYVTREEATRVTGLLRRLWPPRWIRLTDVFGAEVHVLRRTITGITESTDAVRQHERTFRRARRDEEKKDRRPWEDDDWW